MNIKKIYPAEWRKMHPDGMRADSDQYFAGIANQVAQLLAHSGIEDVFPDGNDISVAAKRLTGYFEDICTGLGIWETLIDTFKKRYGKTMPFHDTSEYYPGEPNPQDVQLLLWDIIQSFGSNRFINPENPGIASVSWDIYSIFDREYDDAPDTPELVEYLHDPVMQTDFWQMRKRLEWIFMNSYINLRGYLDFEDSIEEISHDQHAEMKAYVSYLQHLYTDRHNMAMLTPAEWLAALSGQRIDLDSTLFTNRCYRIIGNEIDTIRVRDLANNSEYSVEKYSFDERWINNLSLADGEKNVFMGLVRYNDKFFQCGTLVDIPTEDVDAILKQVRDYDYQRSLAPSNKEQFRKASGGKPIVFVKGLDKLTEFYKKKIKVQLPEDYMNHLRDTVREHTTDGMMALMGTPDSGVLIITGYIPAIKHKDNPFYDPDFSAQYGQGLLMNPNAIDYSAVCTMIDLGMLSDVSLKSFQGQEHGHKLLQDNIQFVADYMFAQHR